MTLSTRQRGTLQWTGEHWVAMLRREDTGDDTAIVSHYSLRISPAGEGNVAVIRITGENGLHAVCTDQPQLLDFALPRFFSKVSYWRPDLPALRCQFTRTGDATRDPGWRIETESNRTIEVRWRISQPPEVINTPWRNNQDVFSILYFTDRATVQLDGEPFLGQPYLRDIWRDTLGGDRSSCVVALAESFFDVCEPVK